jgi:hypothetical protein
VRQTSFDGRALSHSLIRHADDSTSGAQPLVLSFEYLVHLSLRRDTLARVRLHSV